MDVGHEARDDVHRPDGIHLEQHHDRGQVERHEDVLLHGELFVRVLDGDAFRALDDRLRDGVAGDGLGVLRDAEGELEVVEPLEGPGPELEATVLGAHGNGAAPDVGHVHAGPRWTAQGDRGLPEREPGDRPRGGVEDRLQDRRRCAGGARRRILGEPRTGKQDAEADSQERGVSHGGRVGLRRGRRDEVGVRARWCSMRCRCSAPERRFRSR